MESQDLHKIANLLHKNWDLALPEGGKAGADCWDVLRLALAQQMRAMLTQDFERLVQAMYRLDVVEAKFRAAMALPSLEAQALALANIVLERELLRLETWERYRKS